MKQITEDYVSFEIAKLLKEKGFKQDCDYATSWYAAEYYKNSAQGEWFKGEHQIIEDIDDKCTISYLSDEGIFIPAPTHQLALKWLREVKKIHISLYAVLDPPEEGCIPEKITYTYNILDASKPFYFFDEYDECDMNPPQLNSYEEAAEAAILYVLKNLI